ncbi:MAG TPA: hypothetical protein DEA73_06025 [Peptococcaceae bacterium]|nr:MAG: Hemerythrin HHE cation binding domain protein [Moorella sp. 60_41]HBT47419.1 hypothetical protein [Peptococcaceae bacterium]
MLADTLVRQHREILGLLTDIEALGKDGISSRPFDLLIKLGALFGKVKVHLAQEDRGLYPLLLQHPDEQVRERAQRFIRDMGGLREAFDRFRNKYASIEAIKEDPTRFLADVKAIASLTHPQFFVPACFGLRSLPKPSQAKLALGSRLRQASRQIRHPASVAGLGHPCPRACLRLSPSLSLASRESLLARFQAKAGLPCKKWG